MKYTVYILHFPTPLYRVRHYCGITRANRFAERMHEHAHRRGARLTAALARVNSHFIVSWTMDTLDPMDERAIKISGGYNKRCCVCSGVKSRGPRLVVVCPPLDEVKDSPLNISVNPDTWTKH